VDKKHSACMHACACLLPNLGRGLAAVLGKCHRQATTTRLAKHGFADATTGHTGAWTSIFSPAPVEGTAETVGPHHV
jgi:hypothetical protein